MKIDTHILGLLILCLEEDQVKPFLFEIDEKCRDEDDVINEIPDDILRKYDLISKKEVGVICELNEFDHWCNDRAQLDMANRKIATNNTTNYHCITKIGDTHGMSYDIVIIPGKPEKWKFDIYNDPTLKCRIKQEENK